MKLKSEYVLRGFAGKYIAVSVNDTGDNNVLITMNKSSKFVWELLQNDIEYSEVIEKITARYDIDETTAKTDLDEFLNTLRKADMLCDQ